MVHSFLCYCYFLHDACDVWYNDITFALVLDEIEELLELVAEAVLSALALVSEWFFSV